MYMDEHTLTLDQIGKRKAKKNKNKKQARLNRFKKRDVDVKLEVILMISDQGVFK